MGVAVGNRNYFSVNKHTYRKDGGVRSRVHIAGNEERGRERDAKQQSIMKTVGVVHRDMISICPYDRCSVKDHIQRGSCL